MDYSYTENNKLKKAIPKFTCLGDFLYWSYANLGMAYNMDWEQGKYTQLSFIIRAKNFKALKENRMTVQTLFKDQKFKMYSTPCCSYCGSIDKLQLDHLIPKAKGGTDSGDNLVIACQKCNGSKNDTDLMEWYYNTRHSFPTLHILRNYLKLVIKYCENNKLMDKHYGDLNHKMLPFNLNYIPIIYPEAEYIECFMMPNENI